MALAPRMDLRQSQRLAMTPQLQQAIRLLQLSTFDLAAYVQEELETNPLLERDEGGDDSAGKDEFGQEEQWSSGELTVKGCDDDSALNSLHAAFPIAGHEVNANLEGNMSFPFDNQFGRSQWQVASDIEENRNLAEFAADTIDLRTYLLQQLNVSIHEPADRLIGMFLIDQLDENGYLTTDTDQAAASLGAPTDQLRRVLVTLQGFDPAGVFARDLQECLQIQLREKNRLDPAMDKMLENIHLLAQHKLDELSHICCVNAADIIQMIGEIRACDPKPGLKFDSCVSQAIVPDIYMSPKPGGGWWIELNPDVLPKVLVNNSYFATVKNSAIGKEKDYLIERLQSANWLIRALDQRARSILRVATEIVRKQDAFFRRGVTHLRPLVMRDISEEINVHESTVSRVCANKYMATPRGIFELKYFFNSAVPSFRGSEAHAAESVRYRIKLIVDAESPDDVLSDDQIVELLRKDGVALARRTVAKYRRLLRIPSSVQRRRNKLSRCQVF